MEEQKIGTVFIRTKKNRNYTVVDNTFLRDDRLSAQAKGVFAYILYLPEDWCIYQSELVNHFSNGKDALRSAIKELEEFGYISKEHKKDEKTGRFTHWQYTVNEVPVAPKTDSPKAENPTLEIPTLLNTDVIPNTNNNKYSSEKPKSEPFPEYTPSKTKRIRKSDNNKPVVSFPQKDYDDVMSIYYENRDILSDTQNVESTKYLRKSYQSIIKPYFIDYGVDTVKQAVRNSIHHSWIKNTEYSLSVVFNRKKFDEYVADSKGVSSKPRYQNPRTTGGMDYHKQAEHYDIKY